MTKVSREYLEKLIPSYKAKGYPTPKWIQFCLRMLDEGFIVELHRAQTTVSKYVFIYDATYTKVLKIRFSNHKPNRKREVVEEDCDIYVGWTHTGCRTTEQIIPIVIGYLKDPKQKKFVYLHEQKPINPKQAIALMARFKESKKKKEQNP